VWMLFTCLWKLIRILRIRVLSPLLMYVDVILPLALPGLLTYAVPAGDEAAVQEGCRIIVPLRGKRLHTAVVRRIHHQKPGHATEPYLSVLDEQPILSEETLKFWDWTAAHYCCGPGEVALAALPSGMRLASETKLELSPDADDLDEELLGDKEFQIVEALRLRGGLSLKEVGTLLGVVNPAPLLHRLVESGWVLSMEELKASPRRKAVSMVRLSEQAASDERWLNDALDALDARAPSQSRAMMALVAEEGAATGVPLATLTKMEGVTSSLYKGAIGDVECSTAKSLRVDASGLSSHTLGVARRDHRVRKNRGLYPLDSRRTRIRKGCSFSGARNRTDHATHRSVTPIFWRPFGGLSQPIQSQGAHIYVSACLEQGKPRPAHGGGAQCHISAFLQLRLDRRRRRTRCQL